MIPARKTWLFNRWFAGQVRSRLRKSFRAVRVSGLAGARVVSAERPTLVVSNHTSWWDPMFSIFYANHLCGLDGYAMMDAKNLRRLPFLGRVGAFGVDLGDKEDGRRAVRHAAELLNAPKRIVWIFPQGTERPITERPLGFKPGSATVANLAPECRVLPMALRYEMAEVDKPYLYVSIGEPLAPSGNPAADQAAQEAAVQDRLDHIDGWLCGARDPGAFETVLRAPRDRFGAFAERLLARLTR